LQVLAPSCLIDGLQFLKVIRNIDPTVPIVLISGWSEREINERHSNFEDAVFLQKSKGDVTL